MEYQNTDSTLEVVDTHLIVQTGWISSSNSTLKDSGGDIKFLKCVGQVGGYGIIDYKA